MDAVTSYAQATDAITDQGQKIVASLRWEKTTQATLLGQGLASELQKAGDDVVAHYSALYSAAKSQADDLKPVAIRPGEIWTVWPAIDPDNPAYKPTLDRLRAADIDLKAARACQDAIEKVVVAKNPYQDKAQPAPPARLNGRAFDALAFAKSVLYHANANQDGFTLASVRELRREYDAAINHRPDGPKGVSAALGALEIWPVEHTDYHLPDPAEQKRAKDWTTKYYPDLAAQLWPR